MDLRRERILVTGGGGFLGKRLGAHLEAEGVTPTVFGSNLVDLRYQDQVAKLFTGVRPTVIFHLAARVGGIGANQKSPGAYWYDNLQIGLNVLEASRIYGVKKLVVTGTVCFLGSEMVRMANGTYKPISKIEKGDVVLSHKSISRTVTACMRRRYSGKLTVVRAKYGLPIRCTPEHPFLTSRGWVAAKDLTISDVLVQVVGGQSEMSRRVDARFVGHFVADGFMSWKPTGRRGGRHYLYVTPGFNPVECDSIKRSFNEAWPDVPVRIRETRTSKRLEASSASVCERLVSCYSSDRKSAHTKRIPAWIMLSDFGTKLEFLKGYWSGDGCRSRRNLDPRKPVLTCSTVSKELALQIKELLLQFGVQSGIYFRRGRKDIIEEREVNSCNLWSVRTNGKHAARLERMLDSENENVEVRRQVPIGIRSVSFEPFVGDVYNLEVENDSSYVVSGIAVHNCGYPRDTQVPFREENLFNGYPEETNAPYGIAKRSLLVGLQAYRKQYDLNGIFLLPVNLYGPGDSLEIETSHVIPAITMKMLEAVANEQDRVVLWGTGQVSREFLYVDDCARALILAAKQYNESMPVNLGTGREIRIVDLATKIARATGFKGKILWDTSKPDGQPRRCLDTQRAKKFFGWAAETELDDGLKTTVDWYRKKLDAVPS